MRANIAGDLVNLLLGTCAVVYSWLPPQRIRAYRRSIALVLRVLGMVLIGLSAANMLLTAFAGHANKETGRLEPRVR